MLSISISKDNWNFKSCEKLVLFIPLPRKSCESNLREFQTDQKYIAK